MRLSYPQNMVSLLLRLLFSVGKIVLSYGLLLALSIVASVSFMTGKFPPTWKDMKRAKKSMESMLALSRQAPGAPGASGDRMALLQQQMQNLASATGAAQAVAKKANAAAYSDPEMGDVQDLTAHYKRQAALSAALTGEANLGSHQAPSGGGQQAAPSDPAMVNRIRRLEDLVANLHGQVQRLHQQLNRLQNSGSARPAR